jgi:sterol desaturase/sphingolipid hydroxylase (fatty acid hydroxylase superfamily)
MGLPPVRAFATRFGFPFVFAIVALEVAVLWVTSSPWILPIVLVTVIALVTAMEQVAPLDPEWNFYHPARGMQWKRMFTDVGWLVALTGWLSPLYSRLPALLIVWASGTIGTGAIAAAPVVVQAIVLVVVVDLIRYGLHRTLHVTRLWRFHLMHHATTQMTNMRGVWTHPLDDLWTYTPEAVLMVVLGFDTKAIVFFYALDAITTYLNHANLRLDVGWLGRVFMHPRHHILHHAIEAGGAEARNFGEITTLWDRVFGTFDSREVPEGLRIGVEPVARDRSLLQQLLGPLLLPTSRL